MVINRKYEWKPVVEKGEADRIRRDLQLAAKIGFKQILETGSRTVGRGAKEVAARLPGVEIAQELLKAAIDSAAVAIPRQLESLRGLTRLLPSTIRPPISVSKPESDRSSEPFVQEPLPLEIVEAALASVQPSKAESPATVGRIQTEQRPESPFDTVAEQFDLEPESPFDAESGLLATSSDAPVLDLSEEKQCAFEFYDDRVPDVTSHDPAVDVDSDEHEKSAVQTTRFALDPPRTRFVARRLASQGYAKLALSIYEQMLARDPDDRKLKQEAEEIRSGQPVFDSAFELPETLPSTSCVGLKDEENRITSLESNQKELTISWKVTPKGVHRARSVLGEPGELYLRIFEVSSDPVAVVRSTIIEHGPVPASGSWTARELSIDCHRAVAIGLRADHSFAAISHVAFAKSSALSN